MEKFLFYAGFLFVTSKNNFFFSRVFILFLLKLQDLYFEKLKLMRIEILFTFYLRAYLKHILFIKYVSLGTALCKPSTPQIFKDEENAFHRLLEVNSKGGKIKKHKSF